MRGRYPKLAMRFCRVFLFGIITFNVLCMDPDFSTTKNGALIALFILSLSIISLRLCSYFSPLSEQVRREKKEAKEAKKAARSRLRS